MKRRICSLVLAAVIAFSAAGCNQKGDTLNDGYYTARMSDYSHGWMEFVTIKRAEIRDVFLCRSYDLRRVSIQL